MPNHYVVRGIQLTSRATYGKREGLSSRILIVLLLCSVLLNILLARNISDLKEAVLYLKAEMKSARELNSGESIPPLQAKDLEGNAITIDYSTTGATTIIYVFTPSCVWCTRNIENAKTLANISGEDYLFIGLSLSKDGLRDYITQHNIGFPVYSEPTIEVVSAYKLGGTPRTLVVSPEGRILKNWFGAYGADLKREIERYFGVNLPGIAEDDPKEKQGNNEGCETCGGEAKPKS